MGLNDGDQVFLESSQGRVAVRLKFTEELSGQVVYLLHGWREANVNILSDDRLLDPVTGFPACRAIRINIRKK
jgi:predicted molibdopterin-dependent oxidoreductase YjgC